MSQPPPPSAPPWMYPRDHIDGDKDESNQLNTLGLGLRVGRASLPRASSSDLTNGYGTTFSKFSDPQDVTLAQLHRLGNTGVKISGSVEVAYEHSLTHDKIRQDRGSTDTGDAGCIYKIEEHREETAFPGSISFEFEAHQRISNDLLRNLGLGRTVGASAIPSLHAELLTDPDSTGTDFQSPVDIAMETNISQSQSVLSCTGTCTARDEHDIDETVNGSLWLSTSFGSSGIEFRFGLVDDSVKLALLGRISLFTEWDDAEDSRATALSVSTSVILYTGAWSTISSLFPGSTPSDQISAGTFLGVPIFARTLLVDQDFEQHYENASITPIEPLTCANSHTAGDFYEKFDRTGNFHIEATSVSLSDDDLFETTPSKPNA